MSIPEQETTALATKKDLEILSAQLRTEIAEFKADVLALLLDMQNRMYQLILGAYGLIVVGVFLNHFWK